MASGRTLDGGTFFPSVSRSPGVSPWKKAGRPMGPSTPLCYPQSFLLFVTILMSRTRFLTDTCSGLCFGEIGCFFEPFKFRPLSALMRCALLVLSRLLLSFSLFSLFGFFEERKIRDNRLERKVPVSTVNTPSGRRTRPRTSESGGGHRRARVFGHVQVTSTLVGLLSCIATGPQGLLYPARRRV